MGYHLLSSVSVTDDFMDGAFFDVYPADRIISAYRDPEGHYHNICNILP